MASVQTQFAVGGMSCSFCAETIENALERTDGVEEASVSLAHEEVLARFDDETVGAVELKDTLRDLGYTIRSQEKAARYEEQQAELERGKRKLLLSGGASVLVAVLMAAMVARNDWNLFAEAEAAWMGYASLALALGTMFGPGRYIKEKAYQSLRRGILNQHVLLEAGAFAGLAGGFLGLLVWPEFPTVHFFAVSTFVTAYHVLSEYTSLVVRTRASRAVRELLSLQPDTARRVTDAGDLEAVPVEEIEVGDHVRVKPGESVPVDGVIVEGQSAVDESVATGEPTPIDKEPGDEIVGGSVNETGALRVAVTATGEDAFLTQVAHQIEEARAMKPGLVQLADRVLQYFVPAVLVIAAAAFAVWTVLPAVWPTGPLGGGAQVQRGVFAALAVLVLGYPCALGMATPLALIRGGGEAARHGVLLRSGDAFQVFQAVDHAVLDKTGTITEGEPAVDTVVALGSSAEREVLEAAAGAERFSEHPLAAAVCEYAEDRGIDVPTPEEFDSVTGNGVLATVAGSEVLVGKPDWLRSRDVDLSDGADDIEGLQSRGLTVSGVAIDGDLVGVLGIGDAVKPDARETVERLEQAGITPVMLTGDNERTAQTVAADVGIDRVLADVLPAEKREEVRALQDEGHRVAVVGDGINDAPALTQADVGIAIGAGTDIAIESADVVLLGDRIGGVMDAHDIARRSYRKTRQNLAAAFSFNVLGVAAATTGLVHPVFAMLAMVLSVSVVLANSFAGQLVSGDGLKTDFVLDADAGGVADANGDAAASGDAEVSEDADSTGARATTAD